MDWFPRPNETFGLEWTGAQSQSIPYSVLLSSVQNQREREREPNKMLLTEQDPFDPLFQGDINILPLRTLCQGVMRECLILFCCNKSTCMIMAYCCCKLFLDDSADGLISSNLPNDFWSCEDWCPISVQPILSARVWSSPHSLCSCVIMANCCCKLLSEAAGAGARVPSLTLHRESSYSELSVSTRTCRRQHPEEPVLKMKKMSTECFHSWRNHDEFVKLSTYIWG